MTLVSYAGSDGTVAHSWEKPRSKQPSRRMRALFLFRHGKDTFDIASELEVSEAKVLRWVSELRSQFKGLPSPYGVAE